MNDPTSLAPANGSKPGDVPNVDLAPDAGPSLASSPDGDDAHQQTHGQPVSDPPLNLTRMGSMPAFHAPPAPSTIPPVPDVTPLEQRLRRLEDALAQVSDPKQIENRIAERVAERLTNDRPIPVAQIVPAPPPQVAGVAIPTGVVLDMGKRLFATSAGAVKQAVHAPEHADSAVMNGARRTFLFFDILTEARAIWCMYTDPRYKMSWGGRLVPLAFALFLLTSAFLVPGAQLTGIGTVIDKAADLIPAFILFKLLTYEARRYRATAPDLPPELRL